MYGIIAIVVHVNGLLNFSNFKNYIFEEFIYLCSVCFTITIVARNGYDRMIGQLFKVVIHSVFEPTLTKISTQRFIAGILLNVEILGIFNSFKIAAFTYSHHSCGI